MAIRWTLDEFFSLPVAKYGVHALKDIHLKGKMQALSIIVSLLKRVKKS